MTRLTDLYQTCGQSPWLDNVRRDWLHDGHLAQLVADGVRGVTSNPTIFATAMESEPDYDEQFFSLVPGHSIEDAYWEMAITDIGDALALLRPVYDESDGHDGFVSLEVSPTLAHDTDATVAMARQLHERIDRPNLLIKVPATVEGLPAIRTLIGEGHSINVTLIFSLERYQEVMEAYLGGLEDLAASGADDLSTVASVASIFVSRVDTEVDRRLEAAGRSDLAGTAAVAQAKLAYGHFVTTFQGPRWEALERKGARVQRPLWASTKTKNPAYSDLLYVDTLIGPRTVNTMPDATLEAFLDHGTVARSVDTDLPGATQALRALSAAGIDLDDVMATLETEGVASFAKSFDELLGILEAKARGR